MGRRYFLVLIAVLWGCGIDTPINYYISSSCAKKEIELRAIKDGAESWNKATCAEVIKFNGVIEDADFEFGDLEDSKLAIYCVNDLENKDINAFSHEDKSFAAKTIGDILIRKDAVIAWAWRIYHTKTNDKRYDYPFHSIQDKYYYPVLKAIVAHEFGHKFYKDEATGSNYFSVMQQDRLSPLASEEPTKFDLYGTDEISGLCDLIDCPPREHCPTAPKK